MTLDKEKLKSWLKQPENLVFLAIILFAFCIRFYAYNQTVNQPLWWDEAEYMSAAKGYAGLVDYQLSSLRLPGYPMIMSSFFILGMDNESLMRFFALLIPAMIVILLVYLCLIEMYPDKRIALISTAIISVLWEHFFYSTRFQTENFSLIFQFLAFYVLFRVYIKKKEAGFIRPNFALLWIAAFSVISLIFRPTNLPFAAALFVFIVYLDRHKIFTRKNSPWIFASLIVLGVLFVALSNKFSAIIKAYYFPQNPLAWNSLTVFYGFYQSLVPSIPSIFYYTFLFGVLMVLIDFAINSSKFRSISNNADDIELKSDIFNALVVIFVLAMFIFVLRSYQAYEFRWFFPLLIGMFAFTSKGLVLLAEYTGTFVKSRFFVVALIILLVVLGVYTQAVHSVSLIEAKKTSYLQVKEAGLWINENSNKNDVLVSASVPQLTYYSERKVYNFYELNSSENESNFDEAIKLLKPKYVVLSVFEPVFTPQWAYAWPAKHNSTVIPAKAFYLDSSLALVVYEVRYD